MIWLILILLIALFSYREVQILIDRGSWRATEHLDIYWYTGWDGFWKLWDSFHLSNGIITMIICYIVSKYVVKFKVGFLGKYQTTALTVVGWFIFMQIRNLFMGLI